MSRVAISGDVVATPGTTFPYTANGATVADSGKWEAGPVSYETYPALHVGGSPVIWKASCLFSLTGKLGNSPASATETVTLEANPHPLQAQANSVLVHGDSQVSTASGNKLEAIASTALATTT